jgi:hypothetical protein
MFGLTFLPVVAAALFIIVGDQIPSSFLPNRRWES